MLWFSNNWETSNIGAKWFVDKVYKKMILDALRGEVPILFGIELSCSKDVCGYADVCFAPKALQSKKFLLCILNFLIIVV